MGPPRGLRRQGRCWGEQASCLADSCTKSWSELDLWQQCWFRTCSNTVQAIHGDDFVEVTNLTTWTASWRTLSRSSVSKKMELALVMKDTC